MEQGERARLYARVFSTEEGKQVYDDIMQRAGVNRSVFNPTDERRNCFNQGKQALGYLIRDICNADQNKGDKKGE